MLVMRGIRNDQVELTERLAVQAFSAGYATVDHFDTLADMQGLLLLAGTTSPERKKFAIYARDVFGPVLSTIKARYFKLGKFGVNAEELKVLRGFVSIYRDFWLRQPTELFISSCIALQKHYIKLNQLEETHCENSTNESNPA